MVLQSSPRLFPWTTTLFPAMRPDTCVDVQSGSPSDSIARRIEDTGMTIATKGFDARIGCLRPLAY